MGSAHLTENSSKGFSTPSGNVEKQVSDGKFISFQTQPPTPIHSIVIAVTCCAFLFIALDGFRTFAQHNDRLRLTAQLAAAQIAADEGGSILAHSQALPAEAEMILTAFDGVVLASTMDSIEIGMDLKEHNVPGNHVLAHADLGQDRAAIVVAMPVGAIVFDIARRSALTGGGAFALLAIFLLAMRRQPHQPEASRSLMDPAFSTLPMGVAHWCDDGTLICANNKIGGLLRLDAQYLQPGQTYCNFTKQLSGKINIHPVLDSGQQRVVEIEREDGSIVMLDERPCEDGGFVTVATDITERRAADRMLRSIREEQRQLARRYHEEKLRAEAASRTKSTFLAHLSHDIRTPLNHIIGFADMIRSEAFGPLDNSHYQAYVGNICDAGEKLLASFSQILEFAELEGGRKTMRQERFSVDALLEATRDRFRKRALQDGIRLRLGERVSGTLNADRECIERMLDNIMDNALRFTPRGGEVKLAAWQAEDGVVLEITDTGEGMDTEKLSQISQPFVLPDATFTRDHDGARHCRTQRW